MSNRREFNNDDTSSQPDAKRQRKIYLGGPVEDEETAEKKLADKGFDKGNYTRPQEITITLKIADDRDENSAIQKTHTLVSTPMVEFCREGDLKMCRYLLMKGASANHEPYDDDCGQDMFPLLRAVTSNRLSVCMWLYQNGADIRRRDKQGFSLIERCHFNERLDDLDNAWEWLILNGTLTNENGALCADYRVAMRQHSSTAWKSHILSRIDDVQDTRQMFLIFLLGTLHRKQSSELVSSLVLLNGNPGVFEAIADYLGVVRGRHLRIFLQLGPKLEEQISATSEIDKTSGIIQEITDQITDFEAKGKFVSFTVSELTEMSDLSKARLKELRRESDQAKDRLQECNDRAKERLASALATALRRKPEKRQRVAVFLYMAPESSVEEIAGALSSIRSVQSLSRLNEILKE